MVKAEVMNPVLALPSVREAQDHMPAEARVWIRAFLRDISADARARAEKSWRTHKAPMALYWKCIAVYTGHLARALRQPEGER